jgi:hypothetical protein
MLIMSLNELFGYDVIVQDVHFLSDWFIDVFRKKTVTEF